MQIHCCSRRPSWPHREHVRLNVSNAKDRVCHGARRAHIQVSVLRIEMRFFVLILMRIFRIFAQVWPSTGTPALATFISGLAAAVAALFIRLEILVEMMSIGKS